MRSIKSFVKNQENFSLLIIIFFIIFESCKKDNDIIIPQTNADLNVSKKKWTFLLYSDADFPYAYYPLNDFKNAVCSNENMDVLVLQDSIAGPAIYWYIDTNHTNTPLPILSEELNMGSSETLISFINYAKRYYPAERYILALYDHGGGWQGACWDYTNSNDNLTMDDMQQALSKTGGVDFVLFTGPCLMGAIESVYELRNLTKIYIGSENYSGYSSWFYALPYINDMLHINPDISNYDLAKYMMKSIKEHPYSTSVLQDLNMSAILTDSLSSLIKSLNDLSNYYLKDIKKFKSICDSIYTNLTFYGDDIVDLYDFWDKIKEREIDEQIKSKISGFLKSLSKVIIDEIHWNSASRHEHGLSIYFSNKYYYYLYNYAGYGLDMSQDCSWAELLLKYVSQHYPNQILYNTFPPKSGNGFFINSR